MNETKVWILTIIISIVCFFIWNAYIQKDEEEKSPPFETIKFLLDGIIAFIKEDKAFNIIFVVFVSIVPLGIVAGFVLAIKAGLEKLISFKFLFFNII